MKINNEKKAKSKRLLSNHDAGASEDVNKIKCQHLSINIKDFISTHSDSTKVPFLGMLAVMLKAVKP